MALYPFLGWLFGSYTVLRWRRLILPVLLQRLAITAAMSVIVVAVARWVINPGDAVWLVYRRVQLVWMLGPTSTPTERADKPARPRRRDLSPNGRRQQQSRSSLR